MKTKPYNRHETFLAALTDSSITVPDPLTREERYLAKIAGESVTIPDTPYNRYETYLAKLAGEDVTVPTPASRLECYLYKACGYDVLVTTPASREEIFWKRYVGSEVSGSTITITDAAAGAPKSFVIDITPNQAGTGEPSLTNVRPISAWDAYEITQHTSGTDTVYTDSFGENVYAGTFDVVTGSVVSTHGLREYTGSESNFSASRQNKRVTINSDVSSMVPASSGARDHYGWCSHYPVLPNPAYNTYAHTIIAAQFNALTFDACTYANTGFSNKKYISIKDRTNAVGSSDTEAALNYKSYLQAQNSVGTPLQLVYLLASPDTTSLEPPGITLAAGANTFTCNCGTINMKYIPDL